MEQEKPHTLSFKAQISILVILIILTFIEIGIAKIDIGPYGLAAILLVAATQAFIVIAYHMHLKFESTFFKVMVVGMFVLFFVGFNCYNF
ncbi:MAG: hypothetical protein HC905_06355 [Bacteroidales bacterium]|nr:hypothetical protein [Bacteroidales bacterium]